MRRLALALALVIAVPASAQLLDSMSVFRNNGEILLGVGSDALANSAGGASGAATLFDLDTNTVGSGPANLSDSLTINGTALDLVIACDAKDISGTSWPCRDSSGTVTLTQSAGSAPTTGKAAPFTQTTARGVRGAVGGAAFDAAAAGSIATLGTRDFAIESVSQGTNGFTIGGTSSDNATLSGWEYVQTSAGACRPRLNIRDTTTTVTISATTGTCGALQHAIGFGDRSGSMGWYVNGVAAGTAAITTAPNAITNNNAVRILGRPTVAGQTLSDADLYVVRVWACPAATPNCFSTHLNATEAATRFSQVAGVYPTTAVGTALATATTRATSATLDIDRDQDGVRRLATAAAGWMRTTKRKELAGGEYLAGFLPEPTVTNSCLQSETFDNASWVKSASTISANSTSPPDGTTTADGIIADATLAAHHASQTVTLTAATYTFSALLKKGNNNFAGLFNGVLSNGVMFNLNNGTVGNRFAASANVVGGIEGWGNGWYRCWITFTGTAVGTGLFVFTSTADWAGNGSNPHVFSGDAVTVNTSVWGAQVELGAVPSAYIATTSATVTRNGDDLRFSSTGNVATTGGTAVLSDIRITRTAAGLDNGSLLTIGTAAADAILLSVDSNGKVLLTVNVGGVAQASITSTTTLGIGEIRTVRATWQTDSFHLYIDGTEEGTPDVSGTLPTFGGSMFIGERETGTLQGRFPIGRIRILDRPVPGTAAAP